MVTVRPHGRLVQREDSGQAPAGRGTKAGLEPAGLAGNGSHLARRACDGSCLDRTYLWGGPRVNK
jgi:hypothetical protein